MAVCEWCSTELVEAWDAKPLPNPRLYCNQSCRQSAYWARLTSQQRAAQLARKAAQRKRRGGNR